MNGTWRFIKFMIKLTFIFAEVFIFPVFLLCKLLTILVTREKQI